MKTPLRPLSDSKKPKRMTSREREALVSIEELRRRYTYNPETGVLTGLRYRCDITSLTNQGYHAVKIDNRAYNVHRIAWALMTGAWPDHQVDHINRDRSDNRWLNLRAATMAENLRNRSAFNRKTPTSSPYKGVCWSKKYSVWVAQICFNYRNTTIGRYRTQEEAARAYDSEARRLHGEYAVLNFPEDDASRS